MSDTEFASRRMNLYYTAKEQCSKNVHFTPAHKNDHTRTCNVLSKLVKIIQKHVGKLINSFSIALAFKKFFK